MIPIYRKTRKKMADDNKPLKYMRYAIGEIALVVIGILIALQINNWNEAKTQDKKIQAILKQIQTELVSTIEDSNDLIEYYREKDSLINLVMNNKVGEADYKNIENKALRDLSSSRALVMQNDGFNSLMLKSEVLPDKYTSLVIELKQLYNKSFRHLEYLNEQLIVEFWTTDIYIRNNYEWFGDYYYSEGRTDEGLDYYLNDVNYKHSLTNTALLARGLMRTIIKVRIRAIKYIHEIDTLLEVDNIYDFDINVSDYEDWIGKYHFDGDTIQIKYDEVSLKHVSIETQKLYPLSKSKFHLPNELYYVFQKDEQGEIEGYTASSLNIRKFWKKIK